jgi:hypothetical protein
MSENKDQWCFAWYEGEDGSQTRAALEKSSKWPRGSVIKVGFLDGTPQQQALVKQYAVGWVGPGFANLKLSWSPPDEADIRISFAYSGSWSVLGTTCKRVPKNQPTMNFGWLTPTVTAAEARRVILHEFGHALGLIHEHQNPVDSIAWNKPAVYADLSGPPNNWDQDKIDHNMFATYAPQEIEGAKLDRKSIMMYPIPASWVTDGKTAGLNADLSDADKAFIKKAYP